MYIVPQAAQEAALEALPPTASLDAQGSHRTLPSIDTNDLPIIDTLQVCVCVCARARACACVRVYVSECVRVFVRVCDVCAARVCVCVSAAMARKACQLAACRQPWPCFQPPGNKHTHTHLQPLHWKHAGCMLAPITVIPPPAMGMRHTYHIHT